MLSSASDKPTEIFFRLLKEQLAPDLEAKNFKIARHKVQPQIAIRTFLTQKGPIRVACPDWKPLSDGVKTVRVKNTERCMAVARKVKSKSVRKR
jgi:hypothetical protein